MEYLEIAYSFLLASEAIMGFFGIAIGWLFWWALDNFVPFPRAATIAYALIAAVQDAADDTTWDNFIEKFIEQYEKVYDKKPSAGDLKTAADIRGGAKK